MQCDHTGSDVSCRRFCLAPRSNAFCKEELQAIARSPLSKLGLPTYPLPSRLERPHRDHSRQACCQRRQKDRKMQPHNNISRYQDRSEGSIGEKEDITQDEEDSIKSDENSQPRREHRTHHRKICLVSLALVLLISILLTILVSSTRWLDHMSHTKSSPLTLESCGQTPQEARALGCHFDLLSFAWQAPECYDAENTQAFLNHNVNETWTYFADPYDKTPRSKEEAVSGEYVTYVTAEYHFTHCTYMWRQMHRAYMLRGYIDEHLENWNHTLHCQGVLLGRGDEAEMRVVNTVGRIIYPRCRKIW